MSAGIGQPTTIGELAAGKRIGERWFTAKQTQALREKLLPQVRSVEPTFAQMIYTNWPSLQTLTPEEQQVFVWMAHEEGLSHRRHRLRHNRSYFHRHELNAVCGRGRFAMLNKRVGSPFVVENVIDPRKRAARAFSLTPDLAAAKRLYRMPPTLARTRAPFAPCRPGGKRSLKLPAAIASKNSNGRTMTHWREVELPNAIGVDVGALKALYETLVWHHYGETGGNEAAELDTLGVGSNAAYYQANYVRILLERTCDPRCPGPDYIAHHYHHVFAGRLIADYPSLQGAPRLVRAVALNGLFDYDVANCHPTLIEQRAKRLGLDCPAISAYNANKKATREDLAQRVGITVKQAKKVLVATFYGAEPTESAYQQIMQVLAGDVEVVGRLKADPVYEAIRLDIRRCGHAIVEAAPRSGGRIVNSMGLAMRVDGSLKGPARTKQYRRALAHILQGDEASILRVMTRHCSGSVVLAVHDGFVSDQPVDTEDLQSHIAAETGLKVKLEGSVLGLPAFLARPFCMSNVRHCPCS